MKKFFTITTSALLALALVGCGGTETPTDEGSDTAGTDTAAGGETYTLRVATVLTEQDPLVQGLNEFKADVEAKTEGKVVIEVYPASQLGDTADVLEQAKNGSNVGVIIDTGMLADYVPDMAIYSAPYVFNSVENARKFIESDIFKGWDEELAKNGLRDLSCNWFQGARSFMTNKLVEKPEDLAGLSIRTMGSQVAQETIKAVGGTPDSTPWADVYNAIQTKAVDAFEAQTTAIYGASLQEVVTNAALTEHFLLYTALVISETWYQTLPADLQEIVKAASLEAGDKATQYTLDTEKLNKEEMAAAGLTYTEVDKSLFIDATKGVYDTMGWTELKKQIDEYLGQ
ncbi:MAG: C4-dicarboxylate TRAP transporter substrate-binding protein [Bifidobacteriaceae bacterium]|jgi:tripartite ATP-independent transporter DctP family solute receptor|nr:C4-dicarboxylate TRAP transporter substrate-binding protein [Bifidobacteriaceae bacterium]